MPHGKFADIIYQKKDGIAKITINRPKAYNPFTTNTVKEIAQALIDAELDAEVGVVVLTGTGDKAFCTGGDTKEAAHPDGYSREMNHWHDTVHRSIGNMPKVVWFPRSVSFHDLRTESQHREPKDQTAPASLDQAA